MGRHGQDIPLDIKDEQADTMSNNSSITNSSSSSLPTVTGIKRGPDVIFSPLSNIKHLNTAKKFYIKLQPSDHTASFRGICLVFKHKPEVTVSAKPNGVCLFNSISLLLCRSDMYSQII